MKAVHIVLIVFILAVFGIIIVSFLDADPYASFQEAKDYPEIEHQLIGEPLHDLGYKQDSLQNSFFSFYMKDSEGDQMLVYYDDVKPRDFEKLSKVVVTGKVHDTVFIASALFLKCPSKYNDDNSPGEFGNKQFD